MAKMLVCYYSRTKHTEQMAESVAAGAKATKGVSVDVKPVQDLPCEALLDYDAIVVGSPTYYGTMAAEIKRLFDESVKFHGQLNGKVGGAFASSGCLGGGNETTVLDILKAMLIHGMVVQGSPAGAHYGAVSVGEVDAHDREQCAKFGDLLGNLAVKMHG